MPAAGVALPAPLPVEGALVPVPEDAPPLFIAGELLLPADTGPLLLLSVAPLEADSGELSSPRFVRSLAGPLRAADGDALPELELLESLLAAAGALVALLPKLCAGEAVVPGGAVSGEAAADEDEEAAVVDVVVVAVGIAV